LDGKRTIALIWHRFATSRRIRTDK